jgi:phage FluMu protein Com
MITKPCDKCNRMLEYPDTHAGRRVECPDCGDVNLLPEAVAASEKDRAEAHGLPPDSGPEQEVMVLAPAMWRAHPFLSIITLGIATLILWIRNLGNRMYITNKRTILRRGFFSKSTTEVLHDHVRNVQVDQTLLNRMFNVGTIGISSSGQDGIEIVAHAIPRPNEVKKTIDLYRPM